MRKVVAFLFLFLTFTASWILWERHEVTSCFNSPYCMLEKLNAPSALILQHEGNEWRIVTYSSGELILHKLKLSGFLIPEIKESTNSVKTHIDYSPLTFYSSELKGIGGEGIILKLNGSIKVIKPKELQRNSFFCPKLLETCPECKLILGEGGNTLRLGYINLTGGYLILPAMEECRSLFLLRIEAYNSTHDLITAEYPMGAVSGYLPRLDLGPVEGWEAINVSKYLGVCRGILVTHERIVINPNPWGIVEESNDCTVVSKIIINRNGNVEKEDYGRPCWRR